MMVGDAQPQTTVRSRALLFIGALRQGGCERNGIPSAETLISQSGSVPLPRSASSARTKSDAEPRSRYHTGTRDDQRAWAAPTGVARELIRHLFNRIEPAARSMSDEPQGAGDSVRRPGSPSRTADLHANLRLLISELAAAAEGPLDPEDHFVTGEEDPLARPAYALAAVVEFLEAVLSDDAERHLGPLVQLIRWLAELGDGQPVAAFSSWHRWKAELG